MTVSVKCPTCGAIVHWSASSRWRPFCSERCLLIDLGEWVNEAYVIPAAGMTGGDPEGSTDEHDTSQSTTADGETIVQ